MFESTTAATLPLLPVAGSVAATSPSMIASSSTAQHQGLRSTSMVPVTSQEEQASDIGEEGKVSFG